ncbi:MAG TPA: hypothetical protein VI542_32520 [Candidatus Tectomicrobia bacterium]
MGVQVPTPEQVKAAATEVGLSLTDDDIQSYIALMTPNIQAYNLVDVRPDYLPVVRYPRTPGGHGLGRMGNSLTMPDLGKWREGW